MLVVVVKEKLMTSPIDILLTHNVNVLQHIPLTMLTTIHLFNTFATHAVMLITTTHPVNTIPFTTERLDGVNSTTRAVLKMENIAFTYPGASKPQLTGVNVKLCLASRVAVLGK